MGCIPVSRYKNQVVVNIEQLLSQDCYLGGIAVYLWSWVYVPINKKFK